MKARLSNGACDDRFHPTDRSGVASALRRRGIGRRRRPALVARGCRGDRRPAWTSYGVLVFHDQHFTMKRSLPSAATSVRWNRRRATSRKAPNGGCRMDVNDISNLDKNNQLLARDDRRRLFGLGNRLWHSDSSFKTVPAKYSLLSARVFRRQAATRNLPTCGRPMMRWMTTTKAECENLVCEHSQLYSRCMLGLFRLHR